MPKIQTGYVKGGQQSAPYAHPLEYVMQLILSPENQRFTQMEEGYLKSNAVWNLLFNYDGNRRASWYREKSWEDLLSCFLDGAGIPHQGTAATREAVKGSYDSLLSFVEVVNSSSEWGQALLLGAEGRVRLSGLVEQFVRAGFEQSKVRLFAESLGWIAKEDKSLASACAYVLLCALWGPGDYRDSLDYSLAGGTVMVSIDDCDDAFVARVVGWEICRVKVQGAQFAHPLNQGESKLFKIDPGQDVTRVLVGSRVEESDPFRMRVGGVNDPLGGRAVSGSHLEITLGASGECWVRDNGSKYGTLIVAVYGEDDFEPIVLMSAEALARRKDSCNEPYQQVVRVDDGYLACLVPRAGQVAGAYEPDLVNGIVLQFRKVYS